MSRSIFRSAAGELTAHAHREWLASRRCSSTPAYRTYLRLFKPARYWDARARECGALVVGPPVDTTLLSAERVLVGSEAA